MSDTISTTAAPADDLFAGKAGSIASPRYSWSSKARSLKGLHGWLKGALFLFIAVQVFMFLLVAVLLWTFSTLASGQELSPAVEMLLGTIGGLSLFAPVAVIGALVISAFCYLRFVYRAAKNLRLSNARGMDISPGWAVGWTFIPFANLVMIYTVMREIWRASADPERGRRDPPMILGWWWGLWLTGNFAGRISDMLAPQDGDASNIGAFYEAFAPGAYLALVSNALAVASAILLMTIIRQITSSQETLRSTSAFDE